MALDKSKEAVQHRKRVLRAKMLRREKGILTPLQTAWKRWGRKRGPKKKKVRRLCATKRTMILLARKMKREKLAFDYGHLAYFIAQFTDKPELTPHTIHTTCMTLHTFSKGEFYMLRVVFDNRYFYVSI